MSAFEWLQAVASLATAIGVGFLWNQIRLAKKQAVTSFEDALTREYRDLMRQLPVGALLGDRLTPEQLQENLHEFYSYVDLSNQQVFLRQLKRVSAATWKCWCEGIEAQLALPAFRDTWDQIKGKAPDRFAELRRLESERFKDDPADWGRVV